MASETGQDQAESDADKIASSQDAVIDWSQENTSVDGQVTPPTVKSHLAYFDDKHLFRMVVIFSGITLLLSVAGMIGLAACDKDIPEGIVAAASGLIGLMTGTFAARSNK